MPKILVCEDESVLIFLYERIFNKNHITHVCLPHPVEALEKFRSEEFDLVLSDYTLPGMNGVELLKAVRSIKPTQKMALVTSADMNDSIKELKESGVKIFKKPFTIPDLLSLIQEHCGPLPPGAN